jgi:hypothetical protein
MDTSRISVSALGRDVVVGDLYNYYTDDIMKSKIFYLNKMMLSISNFFFFLIL